MELSDILLKTKDPTNHKCAYKYCTIASQKGSPAAMGRLARMCRDGIGCNQDLDTAKFWMKRAAESGVKWAKKEYEELCNTKNNL